MHPCDDTLRLYRNGARREPERTTPGFWSGRIDELAIFDRALTADEIATLYQISLR